MGIHVAGRVEDELPHAPVDTGLGDARLVRPQVSGPYVDFERRHVHYACAGWQGGYRGEVEGSLSELYPA